MWCLTLRTRGQFPTKSTYAGHRSGLFHLFRVYKQERSTRFENELSIIFKGIQKEATGRKVRGETRVKTGKDPLSSDLYRYLSLALLKQKDNDSIFARFFLNLSWNLMCRASNTEFIRLAHISWDGDAMTILFSNAKNDQKGRFQYPRHVYPNPYEPAICPILGLAVYWASMPLEPDTSVQTQLFPGTQQYNRYSKVMKRLWAVPAVKAYLEASGVCETDLGSHSTRKGSATNCASGSTSCPSQAAICL
jgi:integrase